MPSGDRGGVEPVSKLAWATLAISSVAAFMVALEVTVISLALPRIQGAFPASNPSSLSWVFSAYSIGVASLLLVAGWASDLFGRKRLFLVGMTVFAVGSLLSGAAQSLPWLIGARALQSVGGAMLFPSGLALVLAIFPPARRQLAIGIWAAMGGLAGSAPTGLVSSAACCSRPASSVAGCYCRPSSNVGGIGQWWRRGWPSCPPR